MSVVAVRKYDDKIEIASDTILLLNDFICKSKKIYDFNDFVIGFCGTIERKEYIIYQNLAKKATRSLVSWMN